MKLLKNIGWFLLAVLSFSLHLWLHSPLATTSLALGASPMLLPAYSMWPWLEFTVRYLQMGIEALLFILRRVNSTDLFGFPALVWFLSLVVSVLLAR